MTALASLAAAGSTRSAARAVAIVVVLAAITWARWAATVAGGDALVIGLAFGIGLAVSAIVAGQRPSVPPVGAVALGAAGGAVLVLFALLIPRIGPPTSLAPAAPFLPWAAITVLVAAAEEAMLRGALFEAVDETAGLVAAIVITSLAFALIHVPLYGWHVVPLDVGVGVWFAGLRLASGRVAAPAIAHALADLATWWL